MAPLKRRVTDGLQVVHQATIGVGVNKVERIAQPHLTHVVEHDDVSASLCELGHELKEQSKEDVMCIRACGAPALRLRQQYDVDA
jgi:hypothetical protein